MKIYKMSRIVQLKVKCTVINQTANTPAEIVLVVLPFSDYSKTLDQVKQLPKAAIRFLSGSGGIDKATLTKRANLNSYLAVDSRSIRDYQQSASEAASTLALLPDTPILALYVGGASTEPTLRVFIEVDYDIEFFEPEYPGSVALRSEYRKAIDMTDRNPSPRNRRVMDRPNQISLDAISHKPSARRPEKQLLDDGVDSGEIDESEGSFPVQPILKRTMANRL